MSNNTTYITYSLYGFIEEDYSKELDHSLVLPTHSSFDGGIVTSCDVDSSFKTITVKLLIRKGIYTEQEYLRIRDNLIHKGYYVK